MYRSRFSNTKSLSSGRLFQETPCFDPPENIIKAKKNSYEVNWSGQSFSVSVELAKCYGSNPVTNKNNVAIKGN